MPTVIRITRTDPDRPPLFISESTASGYTPNRSEAKVYGEGKEDIRRAMRQHESYVALARKTKREIASIEILDAETDRVLWSNR